MMSEESSQGQQDRPQRSGEDRRWAEDRRKENRGFRNAVLFSLFLDRRDRKDRRNGQDRRKAAPTFSTAGP